MIYWGIIIIVVFILTLLHEIGHYISAKILRLKIIGYGVRLTPYPSIYVSVKYPSNNSKRLFFLLSGFLATMCSFIIMMYLCFFNLEVIFWGYFIQLIIETNPFYSDFTIAYLVKNSSSFDFIKSNNTYIKSKKWYFYFFMWICFVLLLIIYKIVWL